jgi:hypothetical protein
MISKVLRNRNRNRLFERANQYIITHGHTYSFSLSELQRAMERALPGTIVR